MAKKQPAAASKKRAPTSGPGNLEGTVSKLAAQVFAECAFATGQGMESAMNAGGVSNYKVNSKARDYWLRVHTVSIPRALKEKGRHWRADRETVLGKSRQLGEEAAKLAIADTKPGALLVEVLRTHVEQASDTIRKQTDCTPPVGGGHGIYCAV